MGPTDILREIKERPFREKTFEYNGETLMFRTIPLLPYSQLLEKPAVEIAITLLRDSNGERYFKDEEIREIVDNSDCSHPFVRHVLPLAMEFIRETRNTREDVDNAKKR